MHGQRSSATRVDDRGEASTRPPRPLRGHPSSGEEGKLDHPAAFGGTPPQERRGNPTTPPAARAPLLKRGGETRPPRRLRRHPSSYEEGRSGEPEHHEDPSAAFCLAMSSAIPCIASASSASICAAEKGSPSAVPWTSTKPPEPVITTFMSVPHSESSA